MSVVQCESLLIVFWSFYVFSKSQEFFDAEIKKMKIKNCYFPLFVSPGVLKKEEDHIEGFAPEVILYAIISMFLLSSHNSKTMGEEEGPNENGILAFAWLIRLGDLSVEGIGFFSPIAVNIVDHRLFFMIGKIFSSGCMGNKVGRV